MGRNRVPGKGLVEIGPFQAEANWLHDYVSTMLDAGGGPVRRPPASNGTLSIRFTSMPEGLDVYLKAALEDCTQLEIKLGGEPYIGFVSEVGPSSFVFSNKPP
jgi:hypothetical protein